MQRVDRLAQGVDPRMMSFAESTGICYTCKQPCRGHSLTDRANCVQILNDLDTIARGGKNAT